MLRKRPLRRVWTLSAISALTLTGCATTTGSEGPISPAALRFCDGAKPIYWSSKDTDQTIWAVKAHNKVGAQACGWGRK